MPDAAYIVIGLVLGIFIGWLLGRGRQGAEIELRQQVVQREKELAQLRGQLTETSNARAAAEAGKAAAEKLVVEQRELQAKALADLREAFKALSADALKQTAPEFLRLANETFGKFQETAKGDLAQRQEAIKGLVEPLKQQLETYQKRLQQSEIAQTSTLGEVKKQLEMLSQSNLSLANETQQFRMVLKSNQARGRWGEETLRRVVEAAGMSAHCDFSEQTKEGDSKPDLVVRLPGERVIIVDAKVPELDFLSALESADATKRVESLTAHATKLKATIKALADRDYPSQFPNALDYVVLFLPAESLFSAALEGDRDLIVWAAAKHIMLATPASLIALLRSVSVSWQQHAQTKNAQKIAEAAQEFFARVVKFTEHFEKIRAGLERANSAFNDAAASFQTRVRPAGERLAELGGGTSGKELADVQPVDSALRLPPGQPDKSDAEDKW
ncbi:MAG TPA: DNA recombination protein RmuC [Verrucomicrobiota bacterium]|jgi:DNA recombination protein RmuC|nr:DNA recombination protein RmuC [Verrucomicrobiota bacterium]HOA63176.1 DNA recombination protein RmuC [Verrucomicrobiota bacterium]HQK02454.1 DNA recombination protein RmuC [Verrucomicrobiota bacterium]